jgi:hypothetical protein
MDGLPGMQRGVKTAQIENVKPIKKMVGPYAPTAPRVAPSGVKPLFVVLIAFIFFLSGRLSTTLL